MLTIIFVCHGNICRSVAAEYILKKKINDLHLEDRLCCFSRATSNEEIGNDIYPPMKDELRKRGIPFTRHFAERITQKDYDLADYIFYMDNNNKRYLNFLLDDYKNIIKPITCFDDYNFEIEDPWYTDNFKKVCDELSKEIDLIIKNII
ncbi:MAG: low molecular weight phosphotyrosine protein phosphatase [Erysipelotrichaceae bacterium]|nr:low molecular weight phosphotyrosine protein phosphatase [Erysipelotrichaceae bacterium]